MHFINIIKSGKGKELSYLRIMWFVDVLYDLYSITFVQKAMETSYIQFPETTFLQGKCPPILSISNGNHCSTHTLRIVTWYAEEPHGNITNIFVII